jgi:hypothetical protein
MKKKHLVMMAAIIIMSATTNVQAQEGPNGGSGTNTTLPWSRIGDQISGSSNRLGSTNNFPIRFCTNDYDRLFISSDGKVGINTSNPLQKLHILDGNILISRSYPDELGSTNGTIYFGDQVSPSEPYGKWGIEYVSSEREGYGLNFWKPAVTGQNFGNYYLFLADTGNVGIGTNNPQAKLAVNGEILAKSIRVNTSSTYWPDYVFGEKYELMSLKELDAYVKANKHLPGMPSASEVERQGDVDLGEMNVILLEKVEELTRYIIDLQKQIDEMRQIDIKEGVKQ